MLPDADLEQVAAATLTGGYVNAGQVCISIQRVLVADEVYGDLVDALTPLVEGLRTGHPLDAGTTLGPVISETEAERVERTIRAAVDGGATLLAGGERDGAVVAPTIVGDVDPSMELSRSELFGPAVALTRVSGIDQAIAARERQRLRPGRRALHVRASTPRSASPARSTPARSRSTRHRSGAQT